MSMTVHQLREALEEAVDGNRVEPHNEVRLIVNGVSYPIIYVWPMNGQLLVGDDPR